jgi:hypothetical protein
MKTVSLLSSFINLFKPEEEELTPMMDTSLYLIQTTRHNYTGNIIFQDDYVIKFKPLDGPSKPVKILKQNINSIQIVKLQNHVVN